MRKLLCLFIFLLSFVAHIKAQKIDAVMLVDSIKADITQFFIKEGLLDKKRVNGSFDYVFATEIKQNRSVGYDLNGIYRIGVYQSHSPMHILIKEKSKFQIFNLEEIGAVLKAIINYSETNGIGTEFMLFYLNEVTDMYKDNHKTGNFKLKL